MPENLHDTAATLKQNDVYMVDRTAPEGKPYSRKQRDSNAAAVGKTLLYNEDNPSKGVVFEGHEVNDALADGWIDAPLIHPNNPDPVAELKAAPEHDTELVALWAEIDRIGVKPRPHHFSGKEKLMKAITDYG